MNWDDNWVRALVTVGAAALGAILAGLVNAYAARQRIKEVELNYQYKLRDGYLDNARKMTGEVYIPIGVALTNLLKGYERFAAALPKPGEPGIIPIDDFQNCCVDYLETIDGLLVRGADAYLTLELDNELNEFTNFIRNSLREKELRKRVVIRGRIASTLRFNPGLEIEVTRNSWLGKINLPKMSFNLTPFGIGFSYVEKILAASLFSNEFDRAIRVGVIQLKGRIKEVTLGANLPK